MNNQELVLVSTVAQAAAAVVAIVGGFLASRILDHLAQRRRLQQRVADLQRERGLLEDLLEKKESALLRMDAKEFLDAVTPGVVTAIFKGQEPDLQKLVTKHGERGRSVEELQPFFHRHVRVARGAISVLVHTAAKMKSEGLAMPSLEDLQTQGVAAPAAETEPIWAYAHALLEEKWFDAAGGLGAMSKPTLQWSLIYSTVDAETTSRRNRVESEVARNEEELLRVERETSALSRSGPGALAMNDLWGITGALGYMALIGIVWPIALLADVVLVRTHLWRAVLLVAFSAGVAALLAVLVNVIRQLGQDGQGTRRGDSSSESRG